jgi:hypothetical protein
LAIAFGMASLGVLQGEAVPKRDGQTTARFPVLALTALAIGISVLAASGIEQRPLAAGALAGLGIAGIAAFFVLDSRNPQARLFPTRPFDPRTTVGAGMLMVAALSISTVSFLFYGPLLLAALHGLSPLTTGMLIAGESVAWSVLSILVANAPRRREPMIVSAGAVMIAAGISGFGWAIPAGSIPGILLFALLQGGGFGILWPFASRRVIEAARPDEKEITAAAFSTLQRMGYATGGAVAGIIANANGFADGFSRQSAMTAAVPLYLYFVPLALVGVLAAFQLSRLIGSQPSARQAA